MSFGCLSQFFCLPVCLFPVVVHWCMLCVHNPSVRRDQLWRTRMTHNVSWYIGHAYCVHRRYNVDHDKCRMIHLGLYVITTLSVIIVCWRIKYTGYKMTHLTGKTNWVIFCFEFCIFVNIKSNAIWYTSKNSWIRCNYISRIHLMWVQRIRWYCASEICHNTLLEQLGLYALLLRQLSNSRRWKANPRRCNVFCGCYFATARK